MCTLLYNSKWHQDLPRQAHSEEFGEGMLSKLVRDKARNTGSVTVEEVENHYLLLKVGPGGKRVGVQNVPKNLVHSMRQRLTRFLATDRICMAYVEWDLARVSTVATLWPRRLPRFPPSPTQPLGYDYYRLLGHNVPDALIDEKTHPTNQLTRKLDAVVGRRTDMDPDRNWAGKLGLLAGYKYEVSVAVAKMEDVAQCTSVADWGQGRTSITTDAGRAETTAKED